MRKRKDAKKRREKERAKERKRYSVRIRDTNEEGEEIYVIWECCW